MHALTHLIRCLLCQKPCYNKHGLCIACEQSFTQILFPCSQCAEPLPDNISSTICGKCQQSSPCFFQCIAPFTYTHPLDYLIKKFKFHHDVNIGALLGKLLIPHIAAYSIPEALLPVPLHRRRLQSRGFNQAIEIAKPIAKYFDIPILRNSVKRVKATQAQSSLPLNKRRRNMWNAFLTTDKNCLSHYKHIAIIDDVLTSLNTVKAVESQLPTTPLVSVIAVAKATLDWSTT